MRKLSHSLVAPIALAAALLAGAPMPAAAAPPGAIPVFCARGAGINFEQIFTCRRADTRASFTAVPAGLYLHVTDIHVTPNNAAVTGFFSALIGRNDSSDFPTFPSLDLKGSADLVNALHFTTPYIVLHEEESLAVANLSNSEFPIDVYVAGYLATRVSP